MNAESSSPTAICNPPRACVRSSISTGLRSLILTGLAVTSLTAQICQAADEAHPTAPTHKTVQYGDLNLANPGAVEMLYQRIVAAATEVCNSRVDPRVLNAAARDRMCRDQSVTRVIALINRPELTALYALKSHRSVEEVTKLAKR